MGLRSRDQAGNRLRFARTSLFQQPFSIDCFFGACPAGDFIRSTGFRLTLYMLALLKCHWRSCPVSLAVSPWGILLSRISSRRSGLLSSWDIFCIIRSCYLCASFNFSVSLSFLWLSGHCEPNLWPPHPCQQLCGPWEPVSVCALNLIFWCYPDSSSTTTYMWVPIQSVLSLSL